MDVSGILSRQLLQGLWYELLAAVYMYVGVSRMTYKHAHIWKRSWWAQKH